MKIIYKYELEIALVQTLNLRVGAKILCVQSQNNQPVLWALADYDAISENRVFWTFCTGEPIYINMEILEYISTYQVNKNREPFVGHVFIAERGK